MWIVFVQNLDTHSVGVCYGPFKSWAKSAAIAKVLQSKHPVGHWVGIRGLHSIDDDKE